MARPSIRMEVVLPCGWRDYNEKMNWADKNRTRFHALGIEIGFDLRPKDDILDPGSYVSDFLHRAIKKRYPRSVHLGYSAAFGIEKSGQLTQTLEVFLEGLNACQRRHGPRAFGKVSFHPGAFQLQEEGGLPAGPERFNLIVLPEVVWEALENRIMPLREIVWRCQAASKGEHYRALVPQVEIEDVHPFLYKGNGLPIYYAGQLGGWENLYFRVQVPGLQSVVDIAHRRGWLDFYYSTGSFAGLPETLSAPAHALTEAQRILEHVTGISFDKGWRPRAIAEVPLRLSEYLLVFKPTTIHLDFCQEETVVEDDTDLIASHLEPDMDDERHKDAMITCVRYGLTNRIALVPEPVGQREGYTTIGRSATDFNAQIHTVEEILRMVEKLDSGQWPAHN